jgi:hypothetical protein
MFKDSDDVLLHAALFRTTAAWHLGRIRKQKSPMAHYALVLYELLPLVRVLQLIAKFLNFFFEPVEIPSRVVCFPGAMGWGITNAGAYRCRWIFAFLVRRHGLRARVRGKVEDDVTA